MSGRELDGHRPLRRHRPGASRGAGLCARRGLARRPFATSRANASASLSRASSATTRFITPAVAITVAGTCSDVSAHPMARALAARSATR